MMGLVYRHKMLPLSKPVKFAPSREALGLSPKDFKPNMTIQEIMAKERQNKATVSTSAKSDNIDWSFYRSLTSTDIQGKIYEYLTEHGTASAQEIAKFIFGHDHMTMVRRVGGILNRNKLSMDLENYEITLPERGTVRVWRIGKPQPVRMDLNAFMLVALKQFDAIIDEITLIKDKINEIYEK